MASVRLRRGLQASPNPAGLSLDVAHSANGGQLFFLLARLYAGVCPRLLPALAAFVQSLAPATPGESTLVASARNVAALRRGGAVSRGRASGGVGAAGGAGLRAGGEGVGAGAAGGHPSGRRRFGSGLDDGRSLADVALGALPLPRLGRVADTLATAAAARTATVAAGAGDASWQGVAPGATPQSAAARAGAGASCSDVPTGGGADADAGSEAGGLPPLPCTRLLVQAGRLEDAARWVLVEAGGHWEVALALLRRLEAEESYRVGGGAGATGGVQHSGSGADRAAHGSVMTSSHSVLLGKPSPIRCLAVFSEVWGSCRWATMGGGRSHACVCT
jgi:hypothetical protein